MAATPINFSTGNTYLNFRNGTPSQVFLVESKATFGTFTEDYRDPFNFLHASNTYGASKGDRYVSINGTVRNDYSTDHQSIVLDANVYDKNGQHIGSVVRTNGRPEFLATDLWVKTGETKSFSVLFKLDKTYRPEDVGRYEVFLAWEPGPSPPP